MPTDHRAKLAAIKRFDQLIAYLRDEMGWPIARDSFEDVDDLFYDFTADELGIDPRTAAKIQEIKRLRPLSPRQPWGIFFVKFEPKKLPVVALRRILSQVALKKRASANSSERAAWATDDLLFVSNFGEGEERQISFAHFSQAQGGHDLPTLKVLGWDNRDTALHLDAVARELTEQLAWPEDESDVKAWRGRWRAAFTLRDREVVTTSMELSIRLAELARVIRDRITTALAIETERGPLTRLMTAFQAALVHDLDAGGFADMYAQTIAYGLLSARIADPAKKTADDFVTHMRTNPFLRELMETFLKVGGRRGKAGGPGIDFDELGVSEVVELLDHSNMEAVVDDFGDRNPQHDPVIHFYEHFLAAYDPEQKAQRGVFYTPRPIVSYIVRSVDELLRAQFGLEDGLADTTTWKQLAHRQEGLELPSGVSPDDAFVQILDPATGTGTFLVEVVDVVHRTMMAKWMADGADDRELADRWNAYVAEHLLPRLHGYELLMAPYAIAHLKVGLKLYETGYRFASDQRAKIYLTNALEPASDGGQLALEGVLPALAHEARDVGRVKRDQRFTVVIGNPPYAGVSANRGDWIEGLLTGKSPESGGTSYYELEGHPLGEKKVWLQDDYVKFIRMSHALLQRSGAGVHGMITNHAFLDSPTCRGMRFQLKEFFSGIYILDLHGSTKRGERAPEGARDENVFDILPGVAITLCIRDAAESSFRMGSADLWGSRQSKFDWLLKPDSVFSDWPDPRPTSPYYLFVHRSLQNVQEYARFVSLKDVFPFFATGIQTSRDDFATDIDKGELRARLGSFFQDHPDTVREKYGLRDTRGWRVREIRRTSSFQAVDGSIREYLYRVFDRRWIALTKDMVDWPRPEAMACLEDGRLGLLCSRQQATPGFAHVLVVDQPVDMFCISNRSREGQSVFPLYVRRTGDLLSSEADGWSLNIGRDFAAGARRLLGGRSALATLTADEGTAIFSYAYAVLHSPEYRRRYEDLLKMDYPRIPSPLSGSLFRELARLGQALIGAHLLRSSDLPSPSSNFMGPKNPPVVRVGWSHDTVWLDAGPSKKGQPATPGTMGFVGVPERVWSFRIGAYQVCEKWLKDRKGRTLSKDDIAHYQKIVVALNETIRLMQEIDVVIEAHGGWPGAFQTGEAQAAAPKVIPFRPRIVQPGPKERYVTCVPLVPLKVAAGAFSDPQHIDDEGFEWAAVETKRRLRPGMFVAQVVGKSMEPSIPDGAYCLFAAPVEGARQGKTVLVQLRDATDSESGERYTVKRYESEKAHAGDSWRHERITLKPVNSDFKSIVLTGADEGQLQVIAEFVEVLGP